MQKFFTKATVAALIAGAVPFLAFAATATTAKTPFYYGAWVPYWTSTAGEQQIAVNLDSLNEVSPFSYEIVSGGAIKDDLGINQGLWTGWISAVQSGEREGHSDDRVVRRRRHLPVTFRCKNATGGREFDRRAREGQWF